MSDRGKGWLMAIGFSVAAYAGIVTVGFVFAVIGGLFG